MTNKTNLFIIFLCAIALSACAPNPIDVAKGHEITVQADQDARDQEQARAYQETLNELATGERRATSEERQLAYQRVIFWTGVAFSIAAVMIILSVGIGGSWAIVGTGRAVSIAAEFKANQVRLDPVTRQYPLLRQVHGPRWAIENPNTGQVLMLDERNEPDRMLIAAMAAVQHAGVLAREANKNNDVSIIAPLRIDQMENSQ